MQRGPGRWGCESRTFPTLLKLAPAGFCHLRTNESLHMLQLGTCIELALETMSPAGWEMQNEEMIKAKLCDVRTTHRRGCGSTAGSATNWQGALGISHPVWVYEMRRLDS